MKRTMLLAPLVFLGLAASLHAAEIIKESELKPGMKGYGLTVFSGYQVERFEVELIDIVPKMLPNSDVILVRCSGAGLEKSKVIAGMSGSPVYFNGKLAGAIAYAWPFSLDPIAGVTPIESMLAALKAPPKTVASLSAVRTESKFPEYGLKPVGAAITVSGLSSALMPEARAILESLDLGPVMSGGGKIESAEPRPPFQSGSAIAVDLVRGDLVISAVGTATLVEGNTVLAFGHPFFNAGAVSMPMSAAKVHTIISSSAISFKMASAAGDLGTLNLDSEVGIGGRIGLKPNTIPVQIRVSNQSLGSDKTYHYEIADHPLLSPKIVQLCLYESLQDGGAISDRAMVDLDMEMKLEGYSDPIKYQDLFALPGGSFSNEYLAPIFIFAGNPFSKVKISDLKFNLQVRPGWDIAEIRSLWANKTEVSPGDTVIIGVRLRKYQGEEVEKQILFQVPDDAKRMVMLKIMAGDQMPLDIAPPESVSDLIEAFKKLPSPKWLVVQYLKPGLAMDYAGERLKSLPPSAQVILAGKSDTKAKRAPDFAYTSYEMPYLIKGGAMLQLRIKPEVRR